ncbi:pimeloyl-ACP methyl ester carboxylesterase [Nocardia transvalensis]|uniref:Pimeloyl-ACP methyl ester carboxylesterase n=1 Tax=Nocardia transvalensis TaxID=37333 RepID=A0A7W9PLH4_9NOCA|nr:alpha/beta hydrolase [Nocardia transvalensis]MBB5918276.1 pimeloyl-ACP methyl ester carboxylesterase [Nocardia transvalensis]
MVGTEPVLAVSDYEVDGVRCAVHDSGPAGRGEAVVFVHGNPGPMDDWAALAPGVAEFARVIAMDMPGFGRSERPRSFEHSVIGHARFLGRLLDRLGVERAHLVLHDFGGPWGLRWALDNPERLASLTLINTGALEGYRWHKYARIWQTPVLGELFQLMSTPRALRAALSRDNPRPLPRSYAERVHRYADRGHRRAVLRLYRASRDPAAAFPERALGVPANGLPVCVIWGDGDPYIPVRFAEQQRNIFPEAEIHILEGLGHWPFIDDPDAVRTPLEAFLRKQIQPGD